MFPAVIQQPRIQKIDSHIHRDDVRGSENVVVAVKAEKEISKTALAWALTHVVHPGDSITLLAVFSGDKRGRKLWSFPKFSGDCSSSHREKSVDRRCQISESCSQMVLQFSSAYNQNEISVRIKVISASPVGEVAAESKRAGATWVILDKQLKDEEKRCMEELKCNIVVMKRSHPKVLRLNFGVSNEPEERPVSSCSTSESGENLLGHRIRHSTPTSSPEEQRIIETPMSSYNTVASPFFLCEQNPLFEGVQEKSLSLREKIPDSDDGIMAFDYEAYRDSCMIHYQRSRPNLSPQPRSSPTPTHNIYWIPQNHDNEQKQIIRIKKTPPKPQIPISKTLLHKFAESDGDIVVRQQLEHDKLQQRDYYYTYNSNVRDAVSLCRNSPSRPPPLCSLCQHKAPVFGKPPRCFSYRELEYATNGFSEENFLGGGGFGSVHRGVLGDGQVVAVKQLMVASSHGDAEFCAGVEVLSCAQHRNVVMLIGFCVEGRRRVLVHEYICNASLHFHLYGRERSSLDWHARFKIAIGAARGLRYLHEDCRVGCIVHRDVRPNNILLTHDFEPLVGDFGLARWQPDGEVAVRTRVIATFGYLAPEYAESAKITEKADVYAFGVVLLELITGRKAVDVGRPKGQQFLAEWARPLLLLAQQKEEQAIEIDLQLIDPCLDLDQFQLFSHQFRVMACAASLCLRRNPSSRPKMSKVLRVLEGEAVIDMGTDMDSVGSRSGRMSGHRLPSGSISRGLSHGSLNDLCP